MENKSQSKKTSNNNTNINPVKTGDSVTRNGANNSATELKRHKTSLFTRIFAIIGLIVIAGLYVLSLVAALSDWENSFGIFAGALAATIFVPIVIYLFRLFSNKES